ncbi:MAG: hypothetical protein M0Q92_12630 [Methanoregula sp.]|jgi:hypothetical protein|nr:hypothetical protein [Methanoregula sp.]
MRDSLKSARIAIALLAILLTVMTVQACTQKSSCTREDMAACETACTMPDGVLDLYCYEDCVHSIC